MYKKWINKTLTSSIILIILVISINFITDPFQHYRKTTIYPAFFGGDQRYLNPGLAKHYFYDSVIIGTSMTEKLYVPLLNKIFNSSFIKLSISGSTAYEQKLILNQAIKTKQVKRVLWGLDIYSLKGKVEQYRNGKNSFPLHMYDNNILNDYKYLLSKDTFIEFIKIFKKYYIQKDKFYFDINNIFLSNENQNHKVKNNIISIFKQNLVNSNFIKKNFTYQIMKKNFDENIYKTIESNPNINFDIYFPPYSILAWFKMEEKGWLKDAMKLRIYMYNKLKKLKNVYLFDFQSDTKFITNLNNYIDTTHYKSFHNKHIINQIKSKNYLLNVHLNNDRIMSSIKKLRNNYAEIFKEGNN